MTQPDRIYTFLLLATQNIDASQIKLASVATALWAVLLA